MAQRGKMDGLTHMADPIESFAAWLIQLLGGTPAEDSDGPHWRVPTSDHSDQTERVDLSDIARDSDQLAALAQRVAKTTSLPLAVPPNDVQRISELAPSLYSQYEVPEGTIQLAGCQLENRYFVRHTFLQRGTEGPALVHYWFHIDGEPLSDEECSLLGLHRLAVPQRPISDAPSLLPPALRDWRPAAPGAELEPLLTTIAAVKWATGRLEIAHPNAKANAVAIDFSGWAMALRDGHTSPPAYICPATGIRGYRFACTDDGILTVEDAVGVCEHTGRRHLTTELATCVVSGLRVAKSELVQCPVSHDWLLPQEIVACQMCGQEVSPLVIAGYRCRACRSLESVPADDPRIVRMTEDHPQWKTVRRWQLAETDRVYIAIAEHWWQPTLLVVDKDSLEVVKLAKRNRLRRHWQDEITRTPESTSREHGSEDLSSS